MAAPVGIIGKGLRLLRRPTEGQRIIEPLTKKQRAYDKGVVKGAGTGAAAGAAGTSGIEDVMEFIAPGSSVQKEARSNASSKLKNTVRDIKGTPAEIAADKKRTKAAKEKNVPKPKRKPKVPTSTEKSSNPEVYVDSSVTYDMDNMPKKMSGGKVNYRKAGGKIGRGCGAAMRGAGKVMKT